MPPPHQSPTQAHTRRCRALVWSLLAGAVVAVVLLTTLADEHGSPRLAPKRSRTVASAIGLQVLRTSHAVVQHAPAIPSSVLVAWRGLREAYDRAARPSEDLLPFEMLPDGFANEWQPHYNQLGLSPTNGSSVVKAHLTGAVSQLQRRQLAQMGRCITQCSPSAMLSVQMPFCGEVIDFFTCPVTLDGQTKTADSFASREYFTQLRSLPPKEECKVSFKAFTCYRFFPRCTAGQFYRMCRSTCDAFFTLCERSAGLACSAFDGIANQGDDCTGAAANVAPSRLLALVVLLCAAVASWWGVGTA